MLPRSRDRAGHVPRPVQERRRAGGGHGGPRQGITARRAAQRAGHGTQVSLKRASPLQRRGLERAPKVQPQGLGGPKAGQAGHGLDRLVGAFQQVLRQLKPLRQQPLVHGGPGDRPEQAGEVAAAQAAAAK